MAGWACPAWRQVGISPCSRGRLGPSVLAGQAVPIQDTALLHTLTPWELQAPLETWAPLQGWWANLRLAALQSWWPLTMQDHSQGRGGNHQHPYLTQKMRVLHLPHCGTSPLQPPPWWCSQPLVLPDPNGHPTTSCSTPKSCHPSINMWGIITPPVWPPLPGGTSDTMVTTILTPWHPPDHHGPAVGTLIAQVHLILAPPEALDHDYPMLRGTCTPLLQRTPRCLVILILVSGCSQLLWPTCPHSPGSLDLLAIMTLF